MCIVQFQRKIYTVKRNLRYGDFIPEIRRDALSAGRVKG